MPGFSDVSTTEQVLGAGYDFPGYCVAFVPRRP